MRVPCLVVLVVAIALTGCSQPEPKTADEVLQVAEVKRELRDWRKSYTAWYEQLAKHQARERPGMSDEHFQRYWGHLQQQAAIDWRNVEEVWEDHGGSSDDLKVYMREELAQIEAAVDAALAKGR